MSDTAESITRDAMNVACALNQGQNDCSNAHAMWNLQRLQLDDARDDLSACERAQAAEARAEAEKERAERKREEEAKKNDPSPSPSSSTRSSWGYVDDDESSDWQ